MIAVKFMVGNYYASLAIVSHWTFAAHWFHPYCAHAGLTLGCLNFRMGDARDI